MSNQTNIAQYLPLPKASQCTNSNILFYDCQAPSGDILQCAIARITSASELSSIIKELRNPTTGQIKIILTASDLLRSDAVCLIDNVQSNVDNL